MYASVGWLVGLSFDQKYQLVSKLKWVFAFSPPTFISSSFVGTLQPVVPSMDRELQYDIALSQLIYSFGRLQTKLTILCSQPPFCDLNSWSSTLQKWTWGVPLEEELDEELEEELDDELVASDDELLEDEELLEDPPDDELLEEELLDDEELDDELEDELEEEELEEELEEEEPTLEELDEEELLEDHPDEELEDELEEELEEELDEEELDEELDELDAQVMLLAAILGMQAPSNIFMPSEHFGCPI